MGRAAGTLELEARHGTTLFRTLSGGPRDGKQDRLRAAAPGVHEHDLVG